MRGLVGVLLLAGLPADAECRIALALAVDVSRSISADDYAIQRGGLIAALADPGVQSAFLSSRGHVALAVYEWAGREYQAMIVDWVRIDDPGDLAAVAALVATQQQVSQHLPTALGSALEYGRQVMADAPDCAVQVLDVAGDGRNNDGISPADAYARRDFGELVVNGLAIGEHESNLVRYYQTEVIRGPGAFVEVALRQSDYPAAIRRKLIRELSEQVLGFNASAPSLPAPQRVDPAP